MKIKVAFFMHATIKYKFQKTSRWFAALSLPLLEWKWPI